MTTSGQDVRHPLADTITGNSAYLDADINVSAAQATGDYFIHLGDGGTSLFYARTYIKSSGAGFVMAYSFVVSLILGFALHKTIGLRISADAEVEGIDSTEHSETAYDWGRLAGSFRSGLGMPAESSDGEEDKPAVTTVDVEQEAVTA